MFSEVGPILQPTKLEMTMSSNRIKATEGTFDQWVRNHTLDGADVENFRETPVHMRQAAEKILHTLTRRYNKTDDEFTELLDEKDGIQYLKAGRILFALDAEDGSAAGICCAGREHCLSDNAVGVHFLVLNEERDLNQFMRNQPDVFSRSEYERRQEAHREICIRAFERGDPVSEENLSTYALEPAGAACDGPS
jgi:hypothetical protein